MSLIPEPPQIYRSGAWRRGGITVEPVWVRWQGTDVQVYTGNGGLVAEFNAWDLSPLSDPDCIGESELSAGGQAWNAAVASDPNEAGWDNFDFHTMNSEYIEQTYSQPRTFLVNNHLFYIQARCKNGLASGAFEGSLDHPGGWTYANEFPEFIGDTGAIADLLVAKINIDDGAITSASQVCMTMSIDINYGAGFYDFVKWNYDMNVDVFPVVSFLSQQTGLSEKHFAASHSDGDSWTINSSEWTTTTNSPGGSVPTLESSKHRYGLMNSLPVQTTRDSYQSNTMGWASPDRATLSWADRDDSVRNWSQNRYPGPSWFVPHETGKGAQRDAIEDRDRINDGRQSHDGWVGEFFEIPRWAGIDTVNGVVSAYIHGSGYFSPVEVSSFNPNLGDIAGIGRSEFSGHFEDLLLDPETDIDFEMESVSDLLQAAIIVGDGDIYWTHGSFPSYYDFYAPQSEWLENPAESRPETSGPQYFMTRNFETAKYNMPFYLSWSQTQANMHYRISV